MRPKALSADFQSAICWRTLRAAMEFLSANQEIIQKTAYRTPLMCIILPDFICTFCVQTTDRSH